MKHCTSQGRIQYVFTVGAFYRKNYIIYFDIAPPPKNCLILFFSNGSGTCPQCLPSGSAHSISLI